MISEELNITYIGRALCVSTTVLKESAVSELTIKNASRYNRSGWNFHKLPGIKTLFVEWEPLKDQYKKAVRNYLGTEPEEYHRKALILDLIRPDLEAQKYLRDYTNDNDQHLEQSLQDKYYKAAQWLNLLDGLANKTIKVKKDTVRAIRANRWEMFRQMAKAEKVALPLAYPRLMAKLRDYTENGRNYDAVINNRVNNNNARKVKPGICKDVLLEMIANCKQFDGPQIRDAYNYWADMSGYKEISTSLVNHYVRKNWQKVAAFREGEKVHHNQFDKVVHRHRPNHPLYLINHDDNDLDLHYYEMTTGGSKNNRRFVLIVLMDSYNDYPLGYSYSLEAPNVNLIKAAYLDAVHHIHDLTGEWALWHEVKADRFAFKALKPWIESHATFTPAKAKVARSKVIEAAFGKKWHSLLKKYDNYTGHNITAKTRGINPDFVQRARKMYPDVVNGPLQIAEFIRNLRNLPGKTGLPRQKEWLAAWDKVPATEKRLMSHEERLLWFGLPHNESNRLTNAGINTRLMGGRTYDVPELAYRAHVGKSFELVYDPYLPEKVLAVADEGRVRLVLDEYARVPMDIRSRKPGDGERIHERLEEKRRLNQWVIDQQQQRADNLADHGLSASALLQSGVWDKADRISAQRAALDEINGTAPVPNEEPIDWVKRAEEDF